ncbi:MAG: hypothetical protein GY719_41235 [bacterium]|nr:hypothetical protein [bacterium]
MSVRQQPSWIDTDGPFKFLDYFTENDEASFAGRDGDVRTALAGVLKAPSFVLYGGSGTGKTSLLLAGLFPKLRQQGLHPVYARTLIDPLADLRRAILDDLRRERRESAESTEATGLSDLLAELGTEAPVVLVFDQFEEFFIRFRDRPELRDPFIEALGEIAADRRLALKLLFSLRQEFLGELDDFRQHLPQLFDNEYRLKPLSAFGARQAIASQLRTARVPFERRFLTRVVDLLEEYNFDPTILQIVCSEVYRQARWADRGEVRLTAAAVDAVGDVRLLFRRYLDEMAAGLPRESRLTVRAVLDALIAGERTRRAATFETIHRLSTRTDVAVVSEVLKALVRYRLVRLDKQGAESWYELTHERLAEVVREWLELDEDFRRLRTARQLVAHMARGEHWRRDPELLLSAHRLEKVIAPVADHLPLTAAETEYVVRSAIFRRSRDPGLYWLGRYGAAESRRLLLEMLASRDPKAVWGAARMARHAEDPDGELARACARKASAEGDLQIAAEAYFSVLALSRGIEHKRLMRQAVAEVVEETEKPSLWSLLNRRARIWRLLGRARKQAAWQAMSEPYRGLKTRLMDAMAAALLWVFLIGPAIYLAGAWPTGDLKWTAPETLAQARGWGVPVVLLLAAALAATLPATIGRALGRVRPAWSRIVLSAWVLPWHMAWLVLLGFLAFGLATGELWVLSIAGVGAAVLWFVILCGLLLETALLVRLNSTALRADASEIEIWAWSLITSCGLPILAPFVLLFGPAYLLALAGEPGFIEGATAATVAMAMALSFLCFIFQLLLARSGLPPSRRQTPAPRRRRARTVAVVAVFLNLLLFGTGGHDTVPFLAPSKEITGESTRITYSGGLGPGYPDIDFLRLVVSDYELLELTEKPVLPVRVEGLDLDEAEPGHVLALPGPRTVSGDEGTLWAWMWGGLRSLAKSGDPRTAHQIVVGPVESFDWRSLRQKWRLSFGVLDGPIEPSEEWEYRLVRLEKAEEAEDSRPMAGQEVSTWIYSLEQRAGAAESSRAVEVVIFRNQPTAASSAFNGKVEIFVESPEPEAQDESVPEAGADPAGEAGAESAQEAEPESAQEAEVDPAGEAEAGPTREAEAEPEEAAESQTSQNCNFITGPVLNFQPGEGESSRRTWEIDSGLWSDARLKLQITQRRPKSVFLVIGVRLAPEQ